ncbi:MAG: hypothetical protein R3189_04260 [Thiomicrorhabdus chilensis]|uniref:hypothetical protein n=1 Tax=Thiomicrorhabdus chilensis TaxID=63656 RepID=UPI00299E650B|nr:hypothetical protein [Thiomicrorhabdus chilensis]MDX1347447.1 hypothetical protein [Thiomicrorhabdus chilensis]
MEMISENTKIDYLKRYQSLVKQFGFELADMKLEENQTGFIDAANAHADQCSPSTRRTYRAAIRYAFKHYYDIEVDGSLMKSDQSRTAVIQSKGKRTSALKAKKVDPETLQVLLTVLNQSRSKFAKLVKAVLVASTYFGLRPIEWTREVSIIEEWPDHYLKVKNAKHTQGRAFGAYRHLKLDMNFFDSDFEEAFKEACCLRDFFSKLDEQESKKWLTGARDFLNRLYRTDKQLKK